MWLIDTRTLKLQYVTNPEDYKYAILSHTWGNDEVTFQAMKDPAVAEAKIGYRKIWKTCERAISQGLHYAWVDTCCIDKSSSAELSESINSMFQWYRLASICYAWLEDWASSAPPESIEDCRWFTRGWTLQELIAPPSVEFLDHSWAFRGDKSSLRSIIHSITRIDLNVLQGSRPLSEVAVGRRMSWAANRRTTRVEDRAYSLLGIFDINMPLLYGEGQKAFLRLQEEIAENYSDLSLFAWDRPLPEGHLDCQEFFGVFAPLPDDFQNCGTLIVEGSQFHNLSEFLVTNRGLNIHTSLRWCIYSSAKNRDSSPIHLESYGLPLWCHRVEEPNQVLTSPLIKTAFGYVRSAHGAIATLEDLVKDDETLRYYSRHPFYSGKFSKQILISKVISRTASEKIKRDESHFLKFGLSGIGKVSAKGFPPALWDDVRDGFHLAGCTDFIGIIIIHMSVSTMVGEVQIVCGYSEEAGGCWASFVHPRLETVEASNLGWQERECALRLSRFRVLTNMPLATEVSSGIRKEWHGHYYAGLAHVDEARTNNWPGYTRLRDLIFSQSAEKSGFGPKKTRMHIDEPLEFWDIETGCVVSPDINLRAHLTCIENTEIEGASGEIIMGIYDEMKP